MIKKIFIYLLVMTVLSATGGCNIFSFLYKPEQSAESYIADGKGYLNSGDYDNAVASFALAKNAKPNNSDALYWHAIAIARQNNLSVGEIGYDFFMMLYSGSVGEDDLMAIFEENDLDIDALYNAATEITNDLRPITDGSASGEIQKADVMLSFILNLTLSTFIYIAKIKATFDKLGITIDKDGKITFKGLEDMDPEDREEFLNTTFDLLDDAVDGYGALTGDTESEEEFKDITETMRDSIDEYKVIWET